MPSVLYDLVYRILPVNFSVLEAVYYVTKHSTLFCSDLPSHGWKTALTHPRCDFSHLNPAAKGTKNPLENKLNCPHGFKLGNLYRLERWFTNLLSAFAEVFFNVALKAFLLIFTLNSFEQQNKVNKKINVTVVFVYRHSLVLYLNYLQLQPFPRLQGHYLAQDLLVHPHLRLLRYLLLEKV